MRFSTIWISNLNICLEFSYLNPDSQILLSQLNQQMAPQFAKLNKSLIDLVSNEATFRFTKIYFCPSKLVPSEVIVAILIA